MQTTRHTSASLSTLIHQSLGFLFAGSCAFVVDTGTLLLLGHFGLPLMAGRIVSIALAMVVAWWLNRWLTFKITSSPTWKEFGKYVALAASAALLNYTLFVILIATETITQPIAATAIATVISMIFSFLGMKFKVFDTEKY